MNISESKLLRVNHSLKRKRKLYKLNPINLPTYEGEARNPCTITYSLPAP